MRPDYQRAFSTQDFRGYFKWKKSLSAALGGYLYHACHEQELVNLLTKNQLRLRSQWGIRLPEHGECTVPGVWTGLNRYRHGNYYGPFLLKFPIEVLDGKHFICFRRQGEDRERHFFVQYEAMIRIFNFEGNVWRTVNPRHYFKREDDGLYLKTGAIYDIVLTQPIPLEYAKAIIAIDHPKCIPSKCRGILQRNGLSQHDVIN